MKLLLCSRGQLCRSPYDISLLVQLSMLFVLLPSVLLPVGLLASRSIRAHLSTLSLCLPCFLLFASCPGLPLVSGPPCEAPKSSSWRWDGRRRWTRTDTSSIDETEKISIAFRSLSSPCSLSLFSSLLSSLFQSLSLSHVGCCPDLKNARRHNSICRCQPERHFFDGVLIPGHGHHCGESHCLTEEC